MWGVILTVFTSNLHLCVTVSSHSGWQVGLQDLAAGVTAFTK